MHKSKRARLAMHSPNNPSKLAQSGHRVTSAAVRDDASCGYGAHQTLGRALSLVLPEALIRLVADYSVRMEGVLSADRLQLFGLLLDILRSQGETLTVSHTHQGLQLAVMDAMGTTLMHAALDTPAFDSYHCGTPSVLTKAFSYRSQLFEPLATLIRAAPPHAHMTWTTRADHHILVVLQRQPAGSMRSAFCVEPDAAQHLVPMPPWPREVSTCFVADCCVEDLEPVFGAASGQTPIQEWLLTPHAQCLRLHLGHHKRQEIPLRSAPRVPGSPTLWRFKYNPMHRLLRTSVFALKEHADRVQWVVGHNEPLSLHLDLNVLGGHSSFDLFFAPMVLEDNETAMLDELDSGFVL